MAKLVTKILIVGLLLILSLQAVNVVSVIALQDSVQELLERTIGNKMTSSWTDSNSTTHTVETTQNEGESAPDWAGRHQEAVAALQALYPPA